MKEITKTKNAGAAGTAPTNERDLLQNDCIILTPDCQATYTAAGKEFPIKGAIKYGGDYVPLVDIHMMSDYRWQLNCLESRLRDPERYRGTDANVNATILRLIDWLHDNAQNATPEEYEEFLSLLD